MSGQSTLKDIPNLVSSPRLFAFFFSFFLSLTLCGVYVACALSGEAPAAAVPSPRNGGKSRRLEMKGGTPVIM